MVFSVMTPWNLLRCFGGTCCVYFQGDCIWSNWMLSSCSSNWPQCLTAFIYNRRIFYFQWFQHPSEINHHPEDRDINFIRNVGGNVSFHTWSNAGHHHLSRYKENASCSKLEMLMEGLPHVFQRTLVFAEGLLCVGEICKMYIITFICLQIGAVCCA
jgi:hypothetical protein